jgi:hypothetical protein
MSNIDNIYFFTLSFDIGHSVFNIQINIDNTFPQYTLTFSNF